MNSSQVRESGAAYQPTVPVLNSGDTLNSQEFMRRYAAAPENVWAERINGRVYLMSPSRALQHGNPHALLAAWLVQFTLKYSGWIVSDNSTIHLDSDNDPQPDLCLYREGGQTRIENGYLVGPPELVVEVAASSASYDFGEKKEVYQRAGIGEYLIYETMEGRVEWWHHDGSRFIAIKSDAGVFKSRLLPGLWLDCDALQNADANRLIETLRQGMNES